MTATEPITTTFLNAATRYGVPVRPDVDSIVVSIDGDAVRHRRLERVQDTPIDQLCDVYIASGGFTPGSVTKHQGRSRQNLARVWFLPFDCDLADFYAMPKEEVYGLDQAEIEAMLPALVQAATDALRAVGLPVTGIDYTGHGILCRVRLASTDNDRVAEIQTAHKELVRRINDAAGFRLVDPACTDAGTRIVRLVGSLNGKSLAYGQPARLTRPLAESSDYLRVDQLLGLTAERRPAQPTPLLAAHGRELPQEQAQAIVDALHPHWTLGQKHALSLAIGGMLAKAGVPEGQALQIVQTLSADDRKPWDRQNSVTSSYNRVRAGADVRGYFALRDYVPAEVLEHVDGLLDAFRQSNQPRPLLKAGSGRKARADEKDPKRIEASFHADPVPASAFYGWFGDYHRLVEPTTEAPDAFHLGASLVLAGAMIERRVRMSFNSDPLYPNMYALLIGPSATSRKDTAIKRAMHIPQLQLNPAGFVTPQFHIQRSIDSAEGMLKHMEDGKQNTLFYLSEITAVLQRARRLSTSTIVDRLIEAFDTPHVLQNLNKQTPIQIFNPFVSIIAATQPGRFATTITNEDIHSGFANRWLYLPGVRKWPLRPSPPELDRPAAWALYLDLKKVIDSYAEGTVLAFTPVARARWDAWYLNQDAAMSEDEEEAAMQGRHAALIHKIALIYAVSDGANEVRLEHLAPAIELIDWMWRHVRRLMREWGVTRDVQLETRIYDLLDRKGPMKRRDIQRQIGSRQWSAREFAQAIESMLKNGTIAFDPATKEIGIALDDMPEQGES